MEHLFGRGLVRAGGRAATMHWAHAAGSSSRVEYQWPEKAQKDGSKEGGDSRSRKRGLPAQQLQCCSQQPLARTSKLPSDHPVFVASFTVVWSTGGGAEGLKQQAECLLTQQHAILLWPHRG